MAASSSESHVAIGRKERTGLRYCIAVDGSELSLRTFRTAAALRNKGDQMTVLHISDDSKDYLPYDLRPSSIREQYDVECVGRVSTQLRCFEMVIDVMIRCSSHRQSTPLSSRTSVLGRPLGRQCWHLSTAVTLMSFASEWWGAKAPRMTRRCSALPQITPSEGLTVLQLWSKEEVLMSPVPLNSSLHVMALSNRCSVCTK